MRQDFCINDERVLVTLAGNLSMAEAALLRTKLFGLTDEGHKNFYINMLELDYIDSSGMGVLVAVQKRALQKDGGVVLSGLNGVVKTLFEMTNLNDMFEVK